MPKYLFPGLIEQQQKIRWLDYCKPEVLDSEQLVTKQYSYASFKVKVPAKEFKSLRMPSMWPGGVNIRKF